MEQAGNFLFASVLERIDMPTICGLLAEKPTDLSRSMHQAAYDSLGLDFLYKKFDSLDTAFHIDLMRSEGIRGLSLTIPHKETAFDLVDELTIAAKEVGAINTIVNEQGVLRGDNTDCYGISQAFEEASVSWKDKRVLLVGAGGASRAACHALRAAKIIIANRTKSRAETVARDFSLEASNFEELSGQSFDILINATPIGSALSPVSPPEFLKLLEQVSGDGVVFDMVTKETELLERAARLGFRTISGPRMLLHQAVRQVELFTGKPAPLGVMEAALSKALAGS